MFVNRTIIFMGAEAVTVFILLTDAVPSLCLPIHTVYCTGLFQKAALCTSYYVKFSWVLKLQ